MDSIFLCKLDNVREWREEYPVSLMLHEDSNRVAIQAINAGGHDSVEVDLVDLLEWLYDQGFIPHYRGDMVEAYCRIG
jgi:predicted ArsR family transcriptional regulator